MQTSSQRCEKLLHVDCTCKPRAPTKLVPARTYSPVGKPLFVLSVHCLAGVHPTQNRRVAGGGNHGRQLDRLQRNCGGRGGRSTRGGGGRCCGGRCGGGRCVGSRSDGSRRSCGRGESSSSGWSGGGAAAGGAAAAAAPPAAAAAAAAVAAAFAAVADWALAASTSAALICARKPLLQYRRRSLCCWCSWSSRSSQLALLHESAHLGFEDRHGVGMSNVRCNRGGGAGENKALNLQPTVIAWASASECSEAAMARRCPSGVDRRN